MCVLQPTICHPASETPLGTFRIDCDKLCIQDGFIASSYPLLAVDNALYVWMLQLEIKH